MMHVPVPQHLASSAINHSIDLFFDDGNDLANKNLRKSKINVNKTSISIYYLRNNYSKALF